MTYELTLDTGFGYFNMIQRQDIAKSSWHKKPYLIVKGRQANRWGYKFTLEQRNKAREGEYKRTNVVKNEMK